MIGVEFRALVLVQRLNSGRVQLGRLVRYRVVSYDGITAEDLLLGHLINDGRDKLVLEHGLHLLHLLKTLVLVQVELILFEARSLARSRIQRVLAIRQHVGICLALG